MLRVPDLRPGDQPFDPDRDYGIHSGVGRRDHMIRIGREEDAVATEGAILAGLARDRQWNQPMDSGERLRLQAIRRRNADFDDASVRSALTDLHERGDEFVRSLEGLPGREADTITKSSDVFLKEQRRQLTGQLENDRQRSGFDSAFAAYGRDLRERAGRIRDRKTRAWLVEVTERQNQAFLDQALRSENVFDDMVQSRCRTMCLLNVDNLHRDSPEAERAAAVDKADREFCTAVLERRLGLDPARMRVMLDAPAVRRVLGDSAVREFERRAAAAVRREELCALAESWEVAGVTPAELERRARRECRDAAERQIALDHHRIRRLQAGLEEVTGAVLELDAAWRDVLAAGTGDNARLSVLRRTDPELAEYLAAMLRDRRRQGGVAEPADLAFLLEMTDNFDPVRAMEELRERPRLLEIYRRLGGSEAPEFSLFLRFLTGRGTAQDAERLESLREARDLAAACADGSDAGRMCLYLRRYDSTVRITRARHGNRVLTRTECLRLAREAMREMGWHDAGDDGGLPAGPDVPAGGNGIPETPPEQDA